MGREGWSQDGLIPEAAYWFVGGRGKYSVEGIKDRCVERKVVMEAVVASLEW